MGAVFATIAPVFGVAAAGFLWARRGRPFHREAASALNSDLAAPCLVFSRLVTLSIDPAAMGTMALAATLAMLAFAGLGALVLWRLHLPNHTYLAPLVFPNTGNMGLPVCLFAFGEAGLPLAIAYFAVNAVGNFTAGPPIWTGRFHIGELLRTPLVWAVLLAVLVLATPLTVPTWLLRTIHLIGDLSIPLMLLSLGVSMAELRVVSFGRAIGFALLRLGLGVGVGVGLAIAFGFEGAAFGVFVLQSVMPSAVFNHLFAQRYGRSPGEVASIVVLSTAVSFAALPLVLAWLGVSG
ncbi:MAG: AEC family transporter [Myxococcota bacterium]|nr:AEC family transporter [Myxococcota bacterium]